MKSLLVLFACVILSYCIATQSSERDFRCPSETPYLCGDPHSGPFDCCKNSDSCCAPVLNLCCVPWAKCIVNNHTGYAECVKRK